MLSANVALGAMADDMAVKKIMPAGLVVLDLVPWTNRGPKPLACETDQTNRVIPKMGMMMILTMKRYRSLGMLLVSHCARSCRYE